jgi:hypothetical protein
MQHSTSRDVPDTGLPVCQILDNFVPVMGK